MKTSLHLLGLALGLITATAAWSADQAAGNLDQLLDQVRNAAQQNSALSQQREQQFNAQAAQQAQILATAKEALAAEQTRNQQLQAQFDANKTQLDNLINQLHTREGDFSQVFDNARQVASDLKVTLDDSLVSAQYPGRGVFLARLAESRDLPALDDLRKLWFQMQQEMIAEGQVAKFPATVTHEDGSQEKVDVVRVGVFDAVNGDSFLRYLPETGALVQPDRQPASHWRSLAAGLTAATSGVVPMAVDPSGGDLLRSLAGEASFFERVGQGHTIGWLILVLGAIGLFIILERGAYIIRVGGKIKVQMNSSKADLGNPLGRILSVFNESKADDAETLGLRLDESLLRERPVIAARIGLLKILALVSVVLGLLGTVAGVMNTFQAMNLFGVGSNLVASGIATALVPTWLGLIVAAVLLFCHGLLASRSDELMHTLEQQSASILAARAEKLAAMRGAK
ncbi:MAG TPA: MotA/TolQ/ExbB proton channel family protein [Gammaproteobacteria bacterium]|nr:MotA/TolQ/ExbB proton channel family protein [Gammaproteobacteria bacterium]